MTPMMSRKKTSLLSWTTTVCEQPREHVSAASNYFAVLLKSVDAILGIHSFPMSLQKIVQKCIIHLNMSAA